MTIWAQVPGIYGNFSEYYNIVFFQDAQQSFWYSYPNKGLTALFLSRNKVVPFLPPLRKERRKNRGTNKRKAKTHLMS